MHDPYNKVEACALAHHAAGQEESQEGAQGQEAAA
jgi:hypothetical protein